jgi:imidazolonepropionase-like amidohydrolase
MKPIQTFLNLFCFSVCFFALTSTFAQQPFDADRGIILRGTVVTMDAAGTILHNGNVLIRSGKIVVAWEGPQSPVGTPVGDATIIDLGPKVLIFPGLINLHNHPTFNMLNLRPAPSRQPQYYSVRHDANRGRVSVSGNV